MSAPPVCSSESSPMQDRPACMGKPERDPLPRGRAVASAIRRDPAPSPPPAHKRRNDSFNDPATKRALTHDSETVPDFMELSPARDGPSAHRSLINQNNMLTKMDSRTCSLKECLPTGSQIKQQRSALGETYLHGADPKSPTSLSTLSRERPAEANAHVTTATIATVAIKHGSNFITFSEF